MTVIVEVTVEPCGASREDGVADNVKPGGPFTSWISTAEVLAAWVESPLYFPVIEWDPAERADVETLALPPLRVALPSDVPPSKNCTVPVADDGETVAVNVTFWPYVDGFRLEVTVVVVAT